MCMKKCKLVKAVVGVVALIAVIFVSVFLLRSASVFEKTQEDSVAGFAIFTNPAEKSETSVNISFHSFNGKVVCEYTKASDKEFKDAKKIKLTGTECETEEYYEMKEKNVKDYPEYQDKVMYTYHVTINELEPGTEYIYRISTKNARTDTYSFTTGAGKKDFSFIWTSDVHSDPDEKHKINIVNKITEKLEERAANPIELVLFSGDIVKYGNYLSAWREWDRADLTKKAIFAATPGNKEYYKLMNRESESKTKYYSDEWFNDMLNNPQNGAEGIEGTYYFLYNRVLFISLDSCKEKGSGNKVKVDNAKVLKAEQDWFRNTVNSEKGNFDYIVVQLHYEFFIHDYDENTELAPEGSTYSKWHEIFDECGVDFALSGNYHEYCRSKRLYNDAIATDNEHGTVYVTNTELTEYIDLIPVTSSKEERVECYVLGTSTHASIFDVTDEKMTMKLVDYNGDICDTVVVQKKKR